MSAEEKIKSVVVVGHVDHGKSTFIGRLLFDTGNVSPDRLKDIEKTSQELGRKVEYAYLMDQFQEEREANITIDTTQVLLKLEDQSILIIDAPGHKEYLKNMITGATQAHQAILMLDVNEGIREQTDKHARILKLLNIHRIAVLINKMDLVSYGEKVFKDHKGVIEELFKQKGLPVPLVIPISAYNGENVSKRSAQMKWYDGPTAIDFLKQEVEVEAAGQDQSLRFPVQLIYDAGEGASTLGRIERGRVTLNQKLRIFPSGEVVTVKKILKYNQPSISEASSGECVALQFGEQTALKRGDVLCEAANNTPAAKKFAADVFWAADAGLSPGDEILVECRTQSGRAVAQSMKEQLDETSMEKISGGDVGRVIFSAKEPILLEPMNGNSPLSRIVFQKNGEVVGCGVVSEVLVLFLFLVAFTASPSSAYVDPGTGVTFAAGLGGLLWGLITLGFGAIVLTFKKWKKYFVQIIQSITKKP